jgi:short-subunit dehydrogenase
MRQRGGGWIINIGSLAGKNPFAGGAAYNASKFGLLGFSEAMMLDVRDQDIRVSCIMPGSVETHFGGNEPSAAGAWKIQPEDIAAIVMDLLAMNPRTLPSRIEVRPSRPRKG